MNPIRLPQTVPNMNELPTYQPPTFLGAHTKCMDSVLS